MLAIMGYAGKPFILEAKRIALYVDSGLDIFPRWFRYCSYLFTKMEEV